MQPVLILEAYGTIDYNDVIPNVDDIKQIINYKQEFDHGNHSQECLNRKPFEKVSCPWCDKNFLKTPWGIGYSVGVRGKKASVQTAIKYYLISIALGWDALQEQLKYTLQKSYKITSADMTNIFDIWEPQLDKICTEVQNVAMQVGIQTESIKNNKLVEALDITTPYMLRNDGVLLSCGTIHPYIKMYFSESFDTNLTKLLQHPEFIVWFYKNTLLNETRQLIADFLYKLPNQTKLIADLKIEKPEKNKKSIERIFIDLNNITNQEFCRVRTSNFKYKYGGANGEIYFRISSIGFNWFDLIWMVVNEYKDQIKTITIMKDFATFGEQFAYIKDGKHEFNKMPIEEFLTLSGNPVVEELEIEEDIEKHDKLNPKLFKNNKMLPEVQESLLRIANEFIETLAEDNIPLVVKDIQIVGSNASYNYTKDSDIDLHIIADMTAVDDSTGVYTALYNAYKTIWNNKYDLTTNDIPTEIYIEPNEASNISNGCYSVQNNAWIKEPKQEAIPDLNQTEFDTEFAKWEDRYNKIISTNEADTEVLTETALNKSTQETKMDAWHNGSRGANVTQMSDDKLEMNYNICVDKGYTAEATELKKEAINRGLAWATQTAKTFAPSSLTYSKGAINITWARAMLNWLDKNLKTLDLKTLADLGGSTYTEKGALFALLLTILLNAQEKVDLLKQALVFNGFSIDEIKQAINTLLNNPSLIDDLTSICDTLKAENSLEEEVHTPKIDEITQFIQDLYDMRKSSLASDGEYSIGNLIFKEVRNKGYLDKLKELKNKLIGKELSLESSQKQ